MGEPHVISALAAKRAALVGELRAAERRIAELRRQLVHLDETLRLFKPDVRLEEIPLRRPPSRSGYFRRGDLARHVLEVLRRAERPLGARELALRIMAERGLDATDRGLANTLAKSVGQALRRHRGNGLACQLSDGQRVLWQIGP